MSNGQSLFDLLFVKLQHHDRWNRVEPSVEPMPFLEVTDSGVGFLKKNRGTPKSPWVSIVIHDDWMIWSYSHDLGNLRVFLFHQDYFDFPATFSTLVPRHGKICPEAQWNRENHQTWK